MSKFLKSLIPVSLTFLGLEIGSLIVAYQPITTTWRTLHPNGVATNISDSTGLHEFWENGIKKYKFGSIGNRISSISIDNRFKDIPLDNSSKKCRYLVLGDSFSFGWLVDYENAFPTLIQNKFNNMVGPKIEVEFINSAAGGWGLADYHAYLQVYYQNLKNLNLKGIIVFVNSDDGNRSVLSKLYSTDHDSHDIKIIRSNSNYNSTSGKIKRFLNHPLVSPIYNASQVHLNTARIIIRLFLDGAIAKKPKKTLANDSSNSLGTNIGEEVRSSVELTMEQKIKIQRSFSDLRKYSLDIAPLFMVYTGVSPVDNMKPANRYLFSNEFMSIVAASGVSLDFTTLPSKPLYGGESKIQFDGHPNANGHKLIADHILRSDSPQSLLNFVKSSCHEN